jgi:hypothetical protein
VFRWRLYYADGSTFDDTQGVPRESPVRPRVVCVAQPGATGRNPILVGESWFLYSEAEGEWYAVETEGDCLDEIQEDAHKVSCVRKGRWIRNPEFREIWDRAREEAGMHS